MPLIITEVKGIYDGRVASRWIFPYITVTAHEFSLFD